MNIAFNDDALSLILEHLEKTHKELMRTAESWSYDLEGDYDNYVKARQDEMNLAAVINTMKKQRTFRRNNPSAGAEEPLADWEKELLMGQKPTTLKEFMQTVDDNDPNAMNEAVAQGWLTSNQIIGWRNASRESRQRYIEEWSKL